MFTIMFTICLLYVYYMLDNHHVTKPRSGLANDYKIGICCFSAKHAALRRKRKECLTRNQDIVFWWEDMSIRCFSELAL